MNAFNKLKIMSDCVLVVFKFYLIKRYSPTCIKRSPLGQRKSGLISQVTSEKRFNSYKIFYDRRRKKWPFNTGDCLIEVTHGQVWLHFFYLVNVLVLTPFFSLVNLKLIIKEIWYTFVFCQSLSIFFEIIKRISLSILDIKWRITINFLLSN